jgi:hypothetical protein
MKQSWKELVALVRAIPMTVPTQTCSAIQTRNAGRALATSSPRRRHR